VALRIKSLKLGRIGEFLSRAIEPPSAHAIEHVIAVLSGLTALNTGPPSMEGGGGGRGAVLGREELTPLGALLANLPVDPRIGKVCMGS
jgi:HrpA-like RNA helicase